MQLDNLSKKLIGVGLVYYTILVLLSLNVPFFWDTILTSSIAQWFLDNNLESWIPPLIWDAGHPPFFQIYLMGFWKVFGKSLAVSHLAMLPFLYLIVASFVYIQQILTSHASSRVFGFALLLAHPYLTTQATLMSYDIAQLSFFLVFIIAFINRKIFLLILMAWGLSMLSVRGQVIAGIGVVMFVIFEFRSWKKYLPLLFISIIPALIWNLYHFSETGWMLTTTSETWQQHRNITSFKGIFSNIFGILRTFHDYGTTVISILSIVAIYHLTQNKNNKATTDIFFLNTMLFVALSTIMIVFSNPIAHRYFLITHVVMILFITSQWQHFRFKKYIAPLAVVVLISGHFWLYPAKRSNGWDVTLMYLSYEKNRKDFWGYLQEESIAPKSIATAFPLFCSPKQTNLEPANERMIDINSFQFQTEYIAYSPVCNDMRHIDLEDGSLEVVEKFGKGKTAITLYKYSEAGIE